MILIMVFGGGIHPIVFGLDTGDVGATFYYCRDCTRAWRFGYSQTASTMVAGFFIFSVFAGPYLYPLLIVAAFLDTYMLDFRQRIRPSADSYCNIELAFNPAKRLIEESRWKLYC